MKNLKQYEIEIKAIAEKTHSEQLSIRERVDELVNLWRYCQENGILYAGINEIYQDEKRYSVFGIEEDYFKQKNRLKKFAKAENRDQLFFEHYNKKKQKMIVVQSNFWGIRQITFFNFPE